MPLAAVLDSLFGFLLNWPPLLAVLSVSLFISILSLIVTKFTTNQTEMKRLKEEIDANQKKMKTLRDKPEEMLALQRQTMTVNAQYFRHSLIPTLVMLIPLGLLFNWMGGHFGFEPLHPQEVFSATVTLEQKAAGDVLVKPGEGLEVVGNDTLVLIEVEGWFSSSKQATTQLKGVEGNHSVTFTANNQSVEKEIIITTTGKKYAPINEVYKDSVITSVELGNPKLQVFWKLGWLGTYLISAILFISVLRKLLKVY